MNRISVISSNIASVGYEDNVVEIEFNSLSVYQYFNVPKEIYEGLLIASSKGKYFNLFIKDKYECLRIK